jgi:hypothetical protein
MRSLIVVGLLAGVQAYALTSVYKAEPCRADYSGWTSEDPRYDYVSEIITLNVDEIGAPWYVELFVGDLGTAPGAAFQVEAFEHPGGLTRHLP